MLLLLLCPKGERHSSTPELESSTAVCMCLHLYLWGRCRSQRSCRWMYSSSAGRGMFLGWREQCGLRQFPAEGYSPPGPCQRKHSSFPIRLAESSALQGSSRWWLGWNEVGIQRGRVSRRKAQAFESNFGRHGAGFSALAQPLLFSLA